MEKICNQCYINPKAHSLELKEFKNQIFYYYSCPSRAELYNDKEGILNHYNNELSKTIGFRWVWIFDAIDYGLKHASQVSLGIELAKLINEKFSENLIRIYIIHPNLYIKMIYKLIMPFLSNETNKKIKIV